MEKAIIINRIKDLKHWDKKYSRIYLGNEFCSRLLPEKEEIDDILKIIKKEKLGLTLLTGQVDSQGLKIIRKIVKYLAKEQILEEVVINDYGILNYLRRGFPYCQVILGRMLSRFVILRRDSFLNKMGIRRLEFDNFNEIQKCQSVPISYYYPYSVFSTTRYCPMADITNNKLKNHGITKCSKECLEIGELKVNSPILIKSAILKGNAQFIKNKVDFEALTKERIDRLVFQTHVPV